MVDDFAALCRTTAAYRDDLVRNIKSIRISQSLFDDLAETAEEADVATVAEQAQRPPSAVPAISRPFDYGSVIAWSFDSAHWLATRFSDGARYGVWYGAPDVETTVYETAFHWHRFLMDSYSAERIEIIGERRLFSVRCEALLIDLRGSELREPRLVSRESYAFTHALGRYLIDQEQNGVLIASARCSGTNAAVFNPARLSNVRDKLCLTYRCVPAEDRIAVERSPGKRWLTIRPSALN